MIKIKTNTTKVGNALYLVLPKIIHENYKLEKGQQLELELSNETIKITGFTK